MLREPPFCYFCPRNPITPGMLIPSGNDTVMRFAGTGAACAFRIQEAALVSLPVSVPAASGSAESFSAFGASTAAIYAG